MESLFREAAEQLMLDLERGLRLTRFGHVPLNHLIQISDDLAERLNITDVMQLCTSVPELVTTSVSSLGSPLQLIKANVSAFILEYLENFDEELKEQRERESL